MDGFNGYVSVAVGVITVLGALLGWAKQSVQNSIAQARAEDMLKIQGMLNDHQEKTRTWINGSFMRASEVDTRLEGMCERVERIEDRIDRALTK